MFQFVQLNPRNVFTGTWTGCLVLWLPGRQSAQEQLQGEHKAMLATSMKEKEELAYLEDFFKSICPPT